MKLVPLVRRLSIFAGALIAWAVFFSLDGCLGTLLKRFGADEWTVYSNGYSDFRFRRVRKGQTANEVIARIGQPLAIVDMTVMAEFTRLFPKFSNKTHSLTNGGRWEIWEYAMTTNDSSHSIRQIVFSDGVVVGKKTGFYVD